MFVKPVNIEGIFNFTFGTGKGENLIVKFTEFVDSKVYAGGDSRDPEQQQPRAGNGSPSLSS